MNKENVLEKWFSLEGTIAVVTGGCGKLGSEFTQALISAGARVAVFDIVELPANLKEYENGGSLFYCHTDLTVDEEVENAFDAVVEEWGTPTILVNNAGWRASPHGITEAGKPFESYDMNLWDQVCAINLGAAARCARACGRRMIEKKLSGVIVNIASHYALVAPDPRLYEFKEGPFFKDASYSASKAGLVALTRDLAVQWAPQQIRVVALVPGGVENVNADPRFIKAYNERTPLKRQAKLDEYNAALIFLCSPGASYMTGSTLTIDGGWTAW